MSIESPGLPLGELFAAAAAAPGKTPVRFLKLAPPYNPGDVAGFSETYADALVAAKLAERLESPAAAPAPDAGKPKPKPGKPKPPPDQADPSPEGTPDADNP